MIPFLWLSCNEVFHYCMIFYITLYFFLCSKDYPKHHVVSGIFQVCTLLHSVPQKCTQSILVCNPYNVAVGEKTLVHGLCSHACNFVQVLVSLTAKSCGLHTSIYGVQFWGAGYKRVQYYVYSLSGMVCLSKFVDMSGFYQHLSMLAANMLFLSDCLCPLLLPPIYPWGKLTVPLFPYSPLTANQHLCRAIHGNPP